MNGKCLCDISLIGVFDHACHNLCSYISAQDKKRTGAKKETNYTIKHTFDEEIVEFQVVDSVTRFKDSDWYGLLIQALFSLVVLDNFSSFLQASSSCRSCFRSKMAI